MDTLPKIIITAGEPAGIGPDLVLKIAQRDWNAMLVVCACPDILAVRAKQLDYLIHIDIYDSKKPAKRSSAGTMTVLPIPSKVPSNTGALDISNSAYVIETLDKAGLEVLSGNFSALVTGPVQKSIINEAGIPFSGHTEFFADQAKCKKVVMMLANQQMRVALATTHLPLKDVPDAITEPLLTEVISILHKDLQQHHGIAKPHIMVCGLNPHAGENGHLGLEELEVITPTLKRLQDEGYHLTGPMPADTLFQQKYLQDADAVLAMYHDQGLPVLKSHGFGQSVNLTLGLPYIRTSVDHGTALSLAGTGQADASSFICAVESAIELSQKKIL